MAKYFMVAGLVVALIGIAALTNLLGFGRYWEDRANANAVRMRRLLHLPLPPNPLVHPDLRRTYGALMVLIGGVVFVAGLVGGPR